MVDFPKRISTTQCLVDNSDIIPLNYRLFNSIYPRPILFSFIVLFLYFFYQDDACID